MKNHSAKVVLFFTLFSCFTSLLFAQAGKIDSTFGVNGLAHTNFYGPINDIVLQPDGKILAAGTVDYKFSLARYNSNGTLDNSFGASGLSTIACSVQDQVTSVALQPDGKIIVGGFGYINASYNDFILVRFQNNGSLDSSFGVNGVAIQMLTLYDDKINDIALQPDGKIVAVGSTSNPQNSALHIRCIARFNAGGTLDSTFGTNGYTFPNTSTPESYMTHLAIQQDGKIIGVGVDGQNFTVQRYTNTGFLDNSFGTSGTVITTTFNSFHDDIANDVKIQPDGKIVVAGSVFFDSQSNYTFGVARYLTDGSLDNTFGTNGVKTIQFNLSISGERPTSVALQADGKIILAGYLIQPAASSDRFLSTRLLANGNIDSTYGYSGKMSNNFTAYDDVPNAMAIQTDGKIVLAGSYGMSSYLSFGLARYHYRYEDTTCHARFQIYPDSVNQGVYYGIDASTGNNLTYRWEFGDGDTSIQHYPTHTYAQPGQYNVCLTVNGTINCSNTFCDSSFLVFKTENGFMSQLIIRDPNALNISDANTESHLAVYPNPANDELYIYGETGASFTTTIFDLQGRAMVKNTTTNRIDISDLTSGVYVVEIKTKDLTVKRKWVKM